MRELNIPKFPLSLFIIIIIIVVVVVVVVVEICCDNHKIIKGICCDWRLNCIARIGQSIFEHLFVRRLTPLISEDEFPSFLSIENLAKMGESVIVLPAMAMCAHFHFSFHLLMALAAAITAFETLRRFILFIFIFEF